MSAIPASVEITPRVPGASAAPAMPAKAEHRGFGFGDLLDIVNPLQHIPVIGTLYRRLTGDTQSPLAEIAGGALFGGIVGAVASLANVVWAQATGKDFGNTVMAWLGFDGENSPAEVAGAEAPPAVPKPASGGFPLIPLPRMAALEIRAPAPPSAADIDPGLPLLLQAMEKEGVDPGIALRAATAYRSAIGLMTFPAPGLSPAY